MKKTISEVIKESMNEHGDDWSDIKDLPWVEDAIRRYAEQVVEECIEKAEMKENWVYGSYNEYGESTHSVEHELDVESIRNVKKLIK